MDWNVRRFQWLKGHAVPARLTPDGQCMKRWPLRNLKLARLDQQVGCLPIRGVCTSNDMGLLMIWGY